MSGKINLCGIEVNYQNIVNCFSNLSVCQDVDIQESLSKETSILPTLEELDQQMEEYQRMRNILKKHPHCYNKCLNIGDWVIVALCGVLPAGHCAVRHSYVSQKQGQ